MRILKHKAKHVIMGKLANVLLWRTGDIVKGGKVVVRCATKPWITLKLRKCSCASLEPSSKDVQNPTPAKIAPRVLRMA